MTPHSFDNTTCNPYTGTEMQDQYKHAIVWCLDTSGRVVESSAQVSSSSWLSTSQSWDANNNLTSVTDARRNTTNIAYDANGNAVEIALPSQSTYPPSRTLRPTYLFDYDSYNNVTFYCDPANNSSNGWNPSQSDTLCENSGSTYYAKFTWDKGDGNEPYGCLTYGYTPSGYQRTITYTGGTGNCGIGLPTTIAGHSYTEADGTDRTPTQTLTYGSAGNLTTYNVGDPDNALWQLTYSSDGMHHVVAATDPDGVTSHQCYNPDDSLFYSETAYQYVEDGSPPCPSATQIVSGAAAPLFSSAFAYDSDGDVATMIRHHNCPDAISNCTANKSASTNCNSVNVTRGTTCYFYDGLDRMVEVKQPYDTSSDMASDLYSNPWIMRYLYDLTGSQQSFHDQSFNAYGNLFETEELLPQANETGVTTPPTPGTIMSGTYKEIKATAYDGLDRPVAAYSAMGSGLNYTTQTLTWDTSPLDGNVAGLLGKACNGIGQCQKFDYLPNGEILTFQSSDGSSPERDYSYDPDGRGTKILLSGFSNPQQYTYDPNGNLATSVDASNGSVPQNSATLTHNRYPDGSESSLDIASGTLSQTGLFTYSYRNDGPLQTEVINDGSLGNTVANPGKTTLTYTYTDAGRLSLRSESGAGSYTIPMSIQYQPNLGLVHSIEMPEGNTLWQFLFGVENELTSVTDSGCQLPSYTPQFYYSLRGELGGSQSCATGSASGYEANGVSIPWSLSFPGGGSSGSQYTWNNLMAVMTNVQASGSPSSPPPASSWSYDQAGRMTSQAAAYPRFSPSPSPVTVTRTYDAENRLNLTTRESGSQANWPSESVSWGPDGHPILIGTAPNGGSPNNERLHWNGNQLLFTTHSQNGNTVLDDVKVDLQGDILPGSTQVQGYNDLTFYDRGPGGTILGCHNKTGTSYVGFGDGWNWSLGPCGVSQGAQMPTSTVWTGNPYAATLTVGNGGTIGMPRPDGITEGFDTIQGVRAYDSMLGSWTTPDAYSGFVDDPASQKSYLWNENNPLANVDPTGYITIIPQPTPPFAWPNWGEDPEWALWNNYLNLLTIAVVTAHCQGCSNHVSKHYALTMTCSSGSSQVMGAVESNFSRFGNYSRWGGLESVAFFPPSNLAAGSNIPITVTVLGVPQSLSVTVQSMNSQSMTFTTNPGHLLYPASITFAASPSAQGFIDFNINLGGTVTNPLEFAAGGSNFEDAQWNHFVGQVSNFCGAGGGP